MATLDVALTYTNLNLKSATKGPGSPAGEVEALSLATGKVEWDTKVPELPLGAATVSNDLVFTTLYNGVLIALNRRTGAIVIAADCQLDKLPDRDRRQHRDRPAGGPGTGTQAGRRPTGRGVHGCP